MTDEKIKYCLDCGTEVEGRRYRCKKCARKRKTRLSVESAQRLRMNIHKQEDGEDIRPTEKLLSMNGNLPVRNDLLGYLMAKGMNAGY